MAPRNIPLPDLSQTEYRRQWSQNGPGSWWSAGGRVVFTAMGMRRVGRLGIQLGLTDRPLKLLVAPNEEKTALLLMPVRDHAQAVDVLYDKSQCSIDMEALFAYLGRFPLPGTREFHPVEFSKEEVTIGDVTGPALEMPLVATETRWKKAKEKKKPSDQQPAQQAAPAAKPSEQAASGKQP